MTFGFFSDMTHPQSINVYILEHIMHWQCASPYLINYWNCAVISAVFVKTQCKKCFGESQNHSHTAVCWQLMKQNPCTDNYGREQVVGSTSCAMFLWEAVWWIMQSVCNIFMWCMEKNTKCDCAYEIRKLYHWLCGSDGAAENGKFPISASYWRFKAFFFICPYSYVTLLFQILKHFIFLLVISYFTCIGIWISLPSLPCYFFCVSRYYNNTAFQEVGRTFFPHLF